MTNKLYIPAALALLLAQAFFVVFYVSSENTVYFWDHAMYHKMARSLFHGDFALFKQSLSQNYTLIFALPSLPVFWLFGDSRLAFIMANFFFYFVLYEIAVALLFREIFDFRLKKSLFLAFALCFLVPPLWTPLFDGYPDISAAACLVLCLALLTNERRGWSKATLVGILLALAVLLRRHYAYAAIAVAASSAALDAYSAAAKRKAQTLPKTALFYTTSAVCAAVFILLIAPDFLISAIRTDYSSLYKAYNRPASYYVAFAFFSFGYFLIFSAVAGLFYAFRRTDSNKRGLFLVLSASALGIILWCVGPCQVSRHYMLHFLPLLAVVGLAGLFNGPARKEVVFALVFVLAFNFLWSMWFSGKTSLSNEAGRASVFSSARAPEKRKDIKDLVSLAEYLAQTSTEKDKILFVGSSFAFNQNLMASVFSDIAKKSAMISRFLWITEIDGEQRPAVDSFASANIYVVATPTQYHLNPSGQKVVSALAEQFRDAGDAFRKDDVEFVLENGAKIGVWRRDKWAAEKLYSVINDIYRISEYADKSDWIVSAAPFVETISAQSSGGYYFRDFFLSGREKAVFFYSKPLAEGRYRFGTDIYSSKDCGGLSFSLNAEYSKGGTAFANSFNPILAQGSLYNTFYVPKNERYFIFLSMNATVDEKVSCAVVLSSMRIERLLPN